MNFEKLIPINGQIVIKDDPKLDKIGTIYIPDSADTDKVLQGTVVCVSDFMLEDGKLMKVPMKPGNKVLYSIHAGAGNVIKTGSEMYRICRWNEVLAIVGK